MSLKKRLLSGWLPVLLTLPFFLICLFCLVLPLAAVVAASFERGAGSMRAVLSNRVYMVGFWNSFALSACVTVQAAAAGGVLALVWARKAVEKGWRMSILNFAANNGGVNLAFAIIATLGTNGLLTLVLRKAGIHLYPGFDIVSLVGLNFTYLCFLVPYMAILFLPAAGCLRKEWWQAAQTMGARRSAYVIRVAGPILLPSFLASACLVFLNSLGTYATAQAISADRINLITLQIGYLLQTSVFKRADAYTISFLLVLIMMAMVFVYQRVNAKAGRWLR